MKAKYLVSPPLHSFCAHLSLPRIQSVSTRSNSARHSTCALASRLDAAARRVGIGGGVSIGGVGGTARHREGEKKRVRRGEEGRKVGIKRSAHVKCDTSAADSQRTSRAGALHAPCLGHGVRRIRCQRAIHPPHPCRAQAARDGCISRTRPFPLLHDPGCALIGPSTLLRAAYAASQLRRRAHSFPSVARAPHVLSQHERPQYRDGVAATRCEIISRACGACISADVANPRRMYCSTNRRRSAQRKTKKKGEEKERGGHALEMCRSDADAWSAVYESNLRKYRMKAKRTTYFVRSAHFLELSTKPPRSSQLFSSVHALRAVPSAEPACPMTGECWRELRGQCASHACTVVKEGRTEVGEKPRGYAPVVGKKLVGQIYLI
ncbi:hypothetical protein DFH06DRAFT_1445371 [Mycena polygramma]|nr:hypothetical protein DFH06DRAFT_1445371 [Mycena polygramma]